MGCAKDEGSALKEKVAKTQSVNEQFKNFIGVLKVGEETSKDVSSRTDEALTIDETIWGLEAALNVLYARTDVEVQRQERQETNFTIPYANGLVQPSDIFAAYNVMWASVKSHFESYNSTDKAFTVADLEIQNITDSEINVKLTTIVGQVSIQNRTGGLECNHFHPDDDWKVGFWFPGKCDGSRDDSGAANEIEGMVNYFYKIEHPLTPPSENTPCHAGFINYDYVYGKAPDYFNPNWDGEDEYRSHLLLSIERQNSSDFDNVCVEDNNMNWYYCNISNIIANATPPGKDFSYLVYRADFIGEFPTSCHFRFWAYYGKSVWVAGDCPTSPGEQATLDPEKDYLLP